MRLLSVFEMAGRTQAAVIAWLLLGSLSVKATAEGVPDALRQAWRRRQDAVKTARFEWQGDCQMRPWSSEAPLVPIQLPGVFMLDGNKCRYSTRQINLQDKVADRTEGGYLSTFDGRRSMSLTDGKVGVQSVGIIHAPQAYDDIRNIHLLAVTLCLRPLDPSFHGGVQLSDFDVVSRNETIDNRPCVLLRQRSGASEGGIVHLLYVDPAREYVVLRWAEQVNGQLSAQIDITYASDRTIGWVPSAWSLVLMSSGVITERATDSVNEYALNEPLSDKLFAINFPAGTYVDDRPAGTKYLLKHGGEKRLIAPVERRRGATWEQLMTTEYGKAGLRTERWSVWTLTVAIGGFVGLCVVIYLVRRWRSA